jgi:hypothetical protein
MHLVRRESEAQYQKQCDVSQQRSQEVIVEKIPCFPYGFSVGFLVYPVLDISNADDAEREEQAKDA